MNENVNNNKRFEVLTTSDDSQNSALVPSRNVSSPAVRSAKAAAAWSVEEKTIKPKALLL